MSLESKVSVISSVPENVYIKRGSLPVALEELKNVMNKKKVFIVTDTFLYENGYTKVKVREYDIEKIKAQQEQQHRVNLIKYVERKRKERLDK